MNKKKLLTALPVPILYLRLLKIVFSVGKRWRRLVPGGTFIAAKYLTSPCTIYVSKIMLCAKYLVFSIYATYATFFVFFSLPEQ